MSRSSIKAEPSRSQYYAKQQSQQVTPDTQQRVRIHERSAISRQKQQQRDLIKARFGLKASQMKLTSYFLLIVAFVLLAIAFFSTHWLQVERRYYGSKFNKLGLWRVCFNSFSAPDDFQFKKFYVGCRWIFSDEYKPIRKLLLPGLFSRILINCSV